jgi:hypothetical protein
VSGTGVAVPLSCQGTTGATCKVSLTLTTVKTTKGRTLIGVAARVTKVRTTVTVGTGSASLTAVQSQTVTVSLNGAGQKLLGQVSKLPAKLVVTQTLASGQTTTISSQTVAFKGKKHHHKHHKHHR